MNNVAIKEINENFIIPTVSPWDYTIVGLVVLDDEPDKGFKRIGGTTFYSGVQAAALGVSVGIITKGNVEEIRKLWDEVQLPEDISIEIWVEPVDEITTFLCHGRGEERKQVVSKYVGKINNDFIPKKGKILHLGPVLQEIDNNIFESIDYDHVLLGLQGFVRQFDDLDKEYFWGEPKDLESIKGTVSICGGNSLEEQYSKPIIQKVIADGGFALVTHGRDDVEIFSRYFPDGVITSKVEEVEEVDDYGNGDIFSAGVGVGLIKGMDIKDSVALGCKVAGHNIQQVGVENMLRIID